jgi:hypothetical protein
MRAHGVSAPWPPAAAPLNLTAVPVARFWNIHCIILAVMFVKG